MSEEEIKAIDRLKYALIYDREGISSLMGFNDIKKVLQLVDKQQKEIKKLTRLNSAYKTNYDSKVLKEERKNKKILEGYISKDKIINKIKELEQEIEEKQEYGLDLTLIHEHEIDTDAIIQVLNELLEE